MPRPTLDAEQRAPIYTLRHHLASIDDIRILADDDHDEAARLALQYADDFRLFEDIGWDRDDPRDSIRLTMPPPDLRRVVMRLQAGAEGALTVSAAENGETRNELLARLAREQLEKELDTAFESQQGSRYRRIFAEMFGQDDEPFFDPDDELIDISDTERGFSAPVRGQPQAPAWGHRPLSQRPS